MGTTNIILGVGFATLSALIAILVVEVRSLRALAVYLDAAQSKKRDEMVTRGIRALRESLERLDDDPRPDPLAPRPRSIDEDDDEATVVRPRRDDDDERTQPRSDRAPTWPTKK